MTARDDTQTDGSLGSLARMGFIDPDRAQRLLQSLGKVAEPLVPLIARSADPDQALTALVDLADAASDREDLLREAADDEGTSMRLLSVLGNSLALGEHLRRHPDHWHELEDPELGSTRPSRSWLRSRLMEAGGAAPHPEPPGAAHAPDPGTDPPRGE